MVEYFTEALVLNKKDFGETDALVYLYTEELGKVVAKARGLKKIISKLNPHLEPIHFVRIRLVGGKNGYFQAVDTLSFKKDLKKEIKNSPEKLAKFLRIAEFIDNMTFEFQPDFKLWHTIKKIFSSDIAEIQAYRFILKDLGFDPESAECGCGSKKAEFIEKSDHYFLCGSCASNYPENKLLLIKCH